MFNVGDVVRYEEKWCTEAEKDFRFVVVETGLYGNRVKIGCLNSNLILGYVETVDEEMIVKEN